MSGFPDWGNVPEYFTGFALLLAVITFNRSRQEQQRSQAEKVAAWGEEASGRYKVILRNQSELPVTELAVFFNAGFRPTKGLILSKNRRPDRRAKPRYINVLSPGTMEEILPDSAPGPVLVTTLRFTDSRGVCWIRTETGLQRGTKGRIIYLTKRRMWRVKRKVKFLFKPEDSSSAIDL